MYSIDIIKMGLDNLRGYKLRSFLTMLSVIIGTFAIVTIISLGIGLKEKIMNDFAEQGSLREITLDPRGEAEVKVITAKDVRKISKIKNVEWIVPIRMAYGVLLRTDKYETYTGIMGIDEKNLDKYNATVASGRELKIGDRASIVISASFLTQMEEIKKSNSVNNIKPKQIDIDVTKERFHLIAQYDPSETNGGKDLRQSYPIEVIGVIKEESNYEFQYMSIVNMTDFDKIKSRLKLTGPSDDVGSDKNGFDRVIISAKDINDVSKIQEDLKIAGYVSSSMMEYVKSLSAYITIIQLILVSIASISILIAAIGIMNTMMMAISERKKEIGIMKVIGASMKDIQKLFLFEAGFIGFCGGLIGIILCFMLAITFNQFSSELYPLFSVGTSAAEPIADFQLIMIPIWLVVSTMIFTAMIGVLSGYLPARRAMRLSALEAINN